MHCWMNTWMNIFRNQETWLPFNTQLCTDWYKWPEGKPLTLYAQICLSVKLGGWTSREISLGFLLSLTTEPMNFNDFISFLRNFSQGGVVRFFWHHLPGVPPCQTGPGSLGTKGADTEEISEILSSVAFVTTCIFQGLRVHLVFKRGP